MRPLEALSSTASARSHKCDTIYAGWWKGT